VLWTGRLEEEIVRDDLSFVEIAISVACISSSHHHEHHSIGIAAYLFGSAYLFAHLLFLLQVILISVRIDIDVIDCCLLHVGLLPSLIIAQSLVVIIHSLVEIRAIHTYYHILLHLVDSTGVGRSLALLQLLHSNGYF
jgi:hypothetical protein